MFCCKLKILFIKSLTIVSMIVICFTLTLLNQTLVINDALKIKSLQHGENGQDFIITNTNNWQEKSFGNESDINKFEKGFHLNESVTFHSQHKIPLILHQTWDDATVPGQVTNWITSWKKHNPTLQHWFWTEAGSRHLIGQKYPQYLSLYDQYPYKINRADVRRYFIMYLYGGIYADLDVESLKPLQKLLDKYSCLIAQEPLEHQVLLYANQSPNFAMPAFMACRPNHPFFKMLIANLSQYITLAWNLQWNTNILKSTGPMFVAEVLDQYLRLHNNTPENYIHLAPPSWFMPTFDAMNTNAFHQQCSNVSQLLDYQHSVCDQLIDRNYSNVAQPDALTNHHWLHAWGSDFIAKDIIDIASLSHYIKLIDQ